MDHIRTRWTVPLGSIVRNDHKTRLAFKDYGFPSLGRLLKSPGKITLVGTRERDSNHAYIAVIDRVGLRELKKVIASADVCAVDTESTDKDPRKASLFGVALAVSEGQAFYVPVTDTDLRDVSTASVIGGTSWVARLRSSGITSNTTTSFFDGMASEYGRLTLIPCWSTRMFRRLGLFQSRSSRQETDGAGRKEVQGHR